MNNPAIWQFSLNALHAVLWGGSLLLALIVFSRSVSLRSLAAGTLLLTLVLVMLGAFVRLTDAGLGCPDWPGCYGKLSPTQAAEQIQA
ncbi:MAG TPA: COX15/CtaA family protein, partial [Burkholderiales bacterium]